jgi:hypothetical protein
MQRNAISQIYLGITHLLGSKGGQSALNSKMPLECKAKQMIASIWFRTMKKNDLVIR